MRISRSLRSALVVLSATATLGACSLPRSGPDIYEIESGAGTEEHGFEILTVTTDIARMTAIDERTDFSVNFVNTAAEPQYLIARGDTLVITIWENADEGLLSPTGVGASTLPQTRVDERGQIAVPYVGLMPAAGRSLSQLRREIVARLSGKTVDPQVDVFPVEKTGRSVSVQGVVGTPGVYPIDRLTTHIVPMLAKAGGIKIEPEAVRIKLRRGRVQGEIWLTDLYDEPSNDVHLRAGDHIIVERDRRIFTALGAVGANKTLQFPTREVSLVRAMGLASGLRDQQADPTGVFVFREEPPEIARRLFPDREIDGPVRVAYVVDLTQPAGIFVARDFMMRDRDTMYVTNAPYIRWMKIMQAIAPVISFGGAARSLGGF